MSDDQRDGRGHRPVTNRAHAFLEKIVADPGAGIAELATRAWCRGFYQGATTVGAGDLPTRVCADLVIAAVQAWLTEDAERPDDIDTVSGGDWP